MAVTGGAERRWGHSWLGLWLAFLLHVVDEALNDFLSVYNPAVAQLRVRWRWLPLPIFSFEGWLVTLGIALAVLLALTPWVLRGAGRLRPVAYVFSVAMLGNGLLHLGGSLVQGRWLPGVYSSPLLIAAAAVLLVRTRRVGAAL